MPLLNQLTLRKNSAPGFVNKGEPLSSDEIDSNFVRLKQIAEQGGGGSVSGTELNTPNTLVKRDANGNFAAGIITASLMGNATTASTLQVSRQFSILGDVTAPAITFDGSQNVTFNASLVNSGIIAGTYKSLTVDAKGRAIAGTNPTTLMGFGITDAYTKPEIDGLLQGLKIKASVRVATTTNIPTLSGLISVDGVTVANGDRVLVKDQTNPAQNGVYIAATGPWMRATDADEAAELNSGFFTFVQTGQTNADTGWVLITDPPVVVDTSPLLFNQFSSAGQINAGAGLVKNGNVLSIATTGVSAGTFGSATSVPVFTVNDKGQLTNVVNTAIQYPVSSVSGGAGINIVNTNGAVSVANTGVIRIIGGNGIDVNPVGGTGNVTVSLNAAVTQNQTLAFKTIAVQNRSSVVADTVDDTVTFIAGTGMTITTDPVADTITFASAGAQNTFDKFAVQSPTAQPTIQAANTTDTFTFVQGAGISLTTNATNKTLTIASNAVQNSYTTFNVNGQQPLTPNAPNKTLNIAAGTGITITTAPTTDTLTISASSAGSSAISDDTATATLQYPTFVGITTGTANGFKVSSSKLTYQPSTGQLNAVAFNATSDRNAKKDIEDLGYGLKEVLQLKAKSFKMIDDDTAAIGFIAQEAQEIIPEVVGQNGRLLGINYGPITAVHNNAISELYEMILELKAQNEALKEEIKALKK